MQIKRFFPYNKYQLIGILLQITIQFHYYAQSMKIKASYTRAVNKSTVNLHFCDIYLNEQSGFLHDFLHNPLTDNINRKTITKHFV